ncbi:hypothetical protein M407DRAFT_26629 [Tulasnella calospora MUT 4182]|uniref:BZIP domain-containing protein n=1 Tax=Tulasnella calospora MUT 4182 TaxID=1051891 RepID=A0A0C3KR92_9AGAM|nr:hypothetical protein M407DRAFT_26629 [Tulasnella calospora MUT 4182]
MAETAVAPLYKFSSDFSSAGLQGYASSSATPAAGSVEESRRSSSAPSDNGISDPALLEKKRKNASAQAAFRQRRSNYIANLEETVTSLETVVRKLQDACRDAHDDSTELRQENVRLKALLQGFEERERIWKAYAKATAGTPAAVAASQQLAAASAAAAAAATAQPTGSSTSSSLIETPLSSAGSLQEHSTTGSYGEEGTVFGDEPFSFGKVEDIDGEAIRSGLMQQQCSPLSLYSSSSGHSTAVTTSPTPMNFSMDPTDPASGQLTPSSTVDCTFGLSSLSYSANGADGYSVDPNMPPPTYPTSYNSYALNDFTASHRRSLTSSTLALDSVGSDSMDYTTLDAASLDDSKDNSARARRRHTYSSFPAPASSSSRSAPGGRTSAKSSRSNSDAAAAMSNTLAVIKAQAFGNVRKTRARAKKHPASGDAAKAALEILEARGLGLGLDISGGVKRRKRGELPSA